MLVKPEVPTLEENHTAYDKRVREFRMGELMKMERILEGNLCNLFMVLMSLCKSDTKHQVESMNEFPDLEKKMDSMGLLDLKKLVYTSRTNNLNTRHNKAMAHLNLMNLHQDMFQNIQDFRDEYLAMKKVCDVLELPFGRCESDARAVLKKKYVTSPTEAQLKIAKDKIKEEHYAIMFMYKADR